MARSSAYPEAHDRRGGEEEDHRRRATKAFGPREATEEKPGEERRPGVEVDHDVELVGHEPLHPRQPVVDDGRREHAHARVGARGGSRGSPRRTSRLASAWTPDPLAGPDATRAPARSAPPARGAKCRFSPEALAGVEPRARSASAGQARTRKTTLPRERERHPAPRPGTAPGVQRRRVDEPGQGPADREQQRRRPPGRRTGTGSRDALQNGGSMKLMVVCPTRMGAQRRASSGSDRHALPVLRSLAGPEPGQHHGRPSPRSRGTGPGPAPTVGGGPEVEGHAARPPASGPRGARAESAERARWSRSPSAQVSRTIPADAVVELQDLRRRGSGRKSPTTPSPRRPSPRASRGSARWPPRCAAIARMRDLPQPGKRRHGEQHRRPGWRPSCRVARRASPSGSPSRERGRHHNGIACHAVLEQDDRLDVVGLREHVHRLDRGDAVAGRQRTPHVARQRGRVAGHVHRPRRRAGRAGAEPSPFMPVARRVEEHGAEPPPLPAQRGGDGERVPGEEADVPPAQVGAGQVQRRPLPLHRGDRGGPGGQRPGEVPRPAEELEHVLAVGAEQVERLRAPAGRWRRGSPAGRRRGGCGPGRPPGSPGHPLVEEHRIPDQRHRAARGDRPPRPRGPRRPGKERRRRGLAAAAGPLPRLHPRSRAEPRPACDRPLQRHLARAQPGPGQRRPERLAQPVEAGLEQVALPQPDRLVRPPPEEDQPLRCPASTWNLARDR